MPSIAVYNMERQKVSDLEISNDIFAAEVKDYLVHQALKIQLANRRAGTVAVKNRSAVSGGGKKPFKQKGTGGARQGCIRAPHYPGGGVAFGPQPKVYNLSMNKKARVSALCSALTNRFNKDAVTVVDKLTLDKISTNSFASFLKKFNFERALIVTDNFDNNLVLSARNIPYVKLLKHDALTIYDIIKYRNLVFTESSIKSVEEVLSK